MFVKSLPFGASAIEIKAAGNGPVQFGGYASHFTTPDLVGDVIKPGAFARSLKDRPWPVQMLRGHIPFHVIGKWLDVREDDKGLVVRGELTPGHSLAEDTAAMLKHVGGSLSIGFDIPDGAYKPLTKDPFGPREIAEVDLIEISVVTFPADPAARVDSVKAIETISTTRELEDYLRDAGLSRTQARAVVARSRSLPDSLRDAEDGSNLARELADTFAEGTRSIRRR